MRWRWAAMLLFALPALGAEMPAPGPADSFGAAAHGCLQGAAGLPPSGAGWQVMRPDDNRFWGNPALVALIEEQAGFAQHYGRLLIGDLSLPRGGRMPTGHASHQSGLDADILFYFADHPVSIDEGFEAERLNVVKNGKMLPDRWGDAQVAVLKNFAQDNRVERIFVNPAIKRHLCQSLTGDRSWLHRIRPWYGHQAHFHVRINCPAGASSCEAGPLIPAGDGCDAQLDWWFSQEAVLPPAVPATAPPPRYSPSMPIVCKGILSGQ
jgi:penicillin-insensitive murein endopeptidase